MKKKEGKSPEKKDITDGGKKKGSSPWWWGCFARKYEAHCWKRVPVRSLVVGSTTT